MDIMNISIGEIEKELNKFVNNNVHAEENVYPEQIKSIIYRAIEKEYSNLQITSIYYKTNKFSIRIDYNNDFNNISDYDIGNIEIIFSIATLRTEKLVEISNTRKKYVHNQKYDCIKFVEVILCPRIITFEWFNEANLDDINIGLSINHSVTSTYCDKQMKNINMKEIIEKIENNYESKFISNIVQPWIKCLMLKTKRYNNILNVLDEKLKDDVTNNKFNFSELALFIINNNYLKINKLD